MNNILKYQMLGRSTKHLFFKGTDWHLSACVRPVCHSAHSPSLAVAARVPACLRLPAAPAAVHPAGVRHVHCSVTTRAADVPPPPPPPALNQRQRLRLAVRDYGTTVIVFHVTISLASLGVCYAAVKSGLDVVAMLRWLGLGDTLAQSKVVTGGSTFVLAYAVHKVFAPARIATTLGCTPFIVRHLRARGLLRPPAPPPPPPSAP